MNVQQIDSFLELWVSNKLEKLWNKLNVLSQEELAYTSTWMTIMIRDMGEVKLSKWVVWLETKSNNQ